jgi:allophanate hydrolase
MDASYKNESGRTSLLVFGLHMSGQPLNPELLNLGATLESAVRTAPSYRMVLLKRGEKRLPGIWRNPENGVSLGGEIWSLPNEAVGAFFAKVPHPLCLGTLELEDGSWVKGFLCEAVAYEAAEDISAYGGWVKWLGVSG